jgi:hypothetical protein
VMRMYIVGALLAALWAGTPLAAETSTHPIDVRAKVAQCSPTEVLLSIELKNLGQDRIEFFNGDLPWGIRTSLVMAIVADEPDPTMLKPALFIDDPRAGVVALDAMQTVSGTVELSRRFPDLLETLKKRDLLVFWSYSAQLKSGVRTSRASGSTLLESDKCVRAKQR